MGRKTKAKKREWNPDPVYGRIDVARFINHLMRKGKKSLAQKIFYRAAKIIKEKTKKEPLEIFEKAIKNVGPLMEVRSRRIGGANYQIPFEVPEERRFSLACRWLIEAAKKRKGKPMEEKLALELIDASNNQGEAVRKRETVHKMAEANKAFAHFATFKKKKK